MMKSQTSRGTFGSGFTFIAIFLCLYELFTGSICQDVQLTLIQPASFNSTCTCLLGGVEYYSYKIVVDTSGTTAQDWPRILQFSTISKTGGASSSIYPLDFTKDGCITEENRTICSKATGGSIYEVHSTYLGSVELSEGTYQVKWDDFPPSAPMIETSSIPLTYDDSMVTLEANGTKYDLDDAKCQFPAGKGEVVDYNFCANRSDILSLTIVFGQDSQTVNNQTCFKRQHSRRDGEDTYSFIYRDGCGRVKTYSCSIENEVYRRACSDGGIAGLAILSAAFLAAVIVTAFLMCFKHEMKSKQAALTIATLVAIVSGAGIILTGIFDCASHCQGCGAWVFFLIFFSLGFVLWATIAAVLICNKPEPDEDCTRTTYVKALTLVIVISMLFPLDIVLVATQDCLCKLN